MENVVLTSMNFCYIQNITPQISATSVVYECFKLFYFNLDGFFLIFSRIYQVLFYQVLLNYFTLI